MNKAEWLVVLGAGALGFVLVYALMGRLEKEMGSADEADAALKLKSLENKPKSPEVDK